jgi:hypothetical protein
MIEDFQTRKMIWQFLQNFALQACTIMLFSAVIVDVL